MAASHTGLRALWGRSDGSPRVLVVRPWVTRGTLISSLLSAQMSGPQIRTLERSGHTGHSEADNNCRENVPTSPPFARRAVSKDWSYEQCSAISNKKSELTQLLHTFLNIHRRRPILEIRSDRVTRPICNKLISTNLDLGLRNSWETVRKHNCRSTWDPKYSN